MTPEKCKVAETLDEFRGNHRYNLLDENVRRFNAALSQFVIWDDHEVLNNWYPTEILDRRRAASRRSSVALLAARAKRAFLEYTPIRPDAVGSRARLPRVPLRSAGRGLRLRHAHLPRRRTRRTAESPLTDGVRDPRPGAGRVAEGAAQGVNRDVEGHRRATCRSAWSSPTAPTFEAVANGDAGAPLGRELEIAGLLSFIRDERIRNVVCITGDVHYCAAHHYHPARAAFTDFDPFWEFVAGPAHAGTFGPRELDATFGPEVKFVGIPPGMKPNRPPSEGLQFFGTLTANGRTKALTVKLRNLAGDTLYTQELAPER